MHVLIVGAGLGGLGLAQSLRKSNISYEIFERDTHAYSRFQGWCIAVHSIIADIVAAVPDDMPDFKKSVTHFAPLDLPAQIRMLSPGRTERVGYEESASLPMVRAERRRLRDWLATNIPIQWGKRVMRIEHGEEAVAVHFEDGSMARGDILVGADGIKSTVRSQLLGRPSEELLRAVPLASVVGQLTLSGESFRRQLAIGTSGYMCVRPDLGFLAFVGLHFVHPDGQSADYYWDFLQEDADVAEPGHWLFGATQREKLEFVLAHVRRMPPELSEIFEMTAAEGVQRESRIWRDLELDRGGDGDDDEEGGKCLLPPGRVVLIGDAAHAMMPFRGEGGHHTLIDMLILGRLLGELARGCAYRDTAAVGAAVGAFHRDMLERGVKAVRDSRNLVDHAERSGADGKPVRVPIAPLSDLSAEIAAVAA